ncbi:MAG: hypothetical protein F6K54_08495 [Okeania sp. SIO3B5]|nr:hypothetical protein [Okeania sp. SIO3B5]
MLRLQGFERSLYHRLIDMPNFKTRIPKFGLLDSTLGFSKKKPTWEGKHQGLSSFSRDVY